MPITPSLCALLVLAAAGAVAQATEPPPPVPGYAPQPTWSETMQATRTAVMPLIGHVPAFDSGRLWTAIERDFPVPCDWFVQDLQALGLRLVLNDPQGRDYPAQWFSGQAGADLEKKLVAHVLHELGHAGQSLQAESARLDQARPAPEAGVWLDLYARACQQRRELRLRQMIAKCRAFIFTKHYNMGGSHYAYTEGQSDAQAERHFVPGTALCLLEMDGTTPRIRTLVADDGGVIRDPDVSSDGRRVLFAWKKSDRQDDYHLYELELASGQVRTLTEGLGYADYEAAYLPNGDLLFNSTRCVQIVDCFTTEVSNLYTCDKDGRLMRRLGFDQVHSNYPTVTEDGRILYTRWEYNDRGQIFPQALFQMNPDGTNQSEFYGNNSFFPTTILHARGVPGTQKVLAIATGHHSRQVGKLILIDPALGRQENTGVQLIAPVRETPAVRIDSYGQDGELFQYPYPLSETEYLVTYAPFGWGLARGAPCGTGAAGRPPFFGVYYMTIDGRRELLASDPAVSCNQPVPLVRPQPRVRPTAVDYTQTTGTYYVQDVYAGPGLAGIPRGTVKRLRVIAIDFRPALIGGNGNSGPAGGAFVATPVALSNGCWDPKIVLGDATVHEDGSVAFTVPARTPVYFQAIDDRGYMVQTMRSWTTLQPGEKQSCVGCHESKNSGPLPSRVTEALRHAPQSLKPFYGPPRGFSFVKEVQPILNQHCTRCHDDRSQLPFLEGADPPPVAANPKNPDRSFSLLPDENIDPAAKRGFSDGYLVLTGATKKDKRGAFAGQSRPLLNWVSPQSAPPMLPPYSAGAATSGLLPLLEKEHKGVKLSRAELDRIACWIDLVIPYCADYYEAHAWTPAEVERYHKMLEKRQRMEQFERSNIAQFLTERGRP